MNKRVLVIGGGIAGLTAARTLDANGVAVTVLEAKDRLGGRIHTIHHETTPIELGAEFVHGKDPALVQLIRDAGLSTRDVPDQNRISAGGKLKRVPMWEFIGELIHRVDPRESDEPFTQFSADRKQPQRSARWRLGLWRASMPRTRRS